MITYIGINLAGILGDVGPDPEGLAGARDGCGERYGVRYGVPLPPGEVVLEFPEKNSSIEMVFW